MTWVAIWGLVKRLSTPLLVVSVLALIALGSWAILEKVKTNSEINALKEKVSEAEKETAAVKLDLAQAQKKGVEELAAKQDENTKLALSWQERFNQAEKDRLREKTSFEATLAQRNVDRDQLRYITSSLTSYRPIASGESCDSGALSRANETAETFGQLLSASDGVSESVGIEAEDLARQVRGLQASLTALRSQTVAKAP